MTQTGSDRIDALIIDPLGRKLGTLKTGDQYFLVNEIPGAVVQPDILFDEANAVFGIGYIPNPVEGNYAVIIYGKEPADYTVQNVHWTGGAMVQNDIVTDHIEAGQIKGQNFLNANVNMDPDTINLMSNGKWITAYIEIPGYDVSKIDLNSVSLNGLVPAVTDLKYGFVKNLEISDRDHDGNPELMVKFDREQVQDLLAKGQSEVFVIGEISGKQFMGINPIHVIS